MWEEYNNAIACTHKSEVNNEISQQTLVQACVVGNAAHGLPSSGVKPLTIRYKCQASSCIHVHERVMILTAHCNVDVDVSTQITFLYLYTYLYILSSYVHVSTQITFLYILSSYGWQRKNEQLQIVFAAADSIENLQQVQETVDYLTQGCMCKTGCESKHCKCKKGPLHWGPAKIHTAVCGSNMSN